MAGSNVLRGVAEDDTIFIRQGEAFASGNLLSNDGAEGAPAFSLRNVSGQSIAASGKAPSEVTVIGQFGTFKVKADGSYTYTVNDGVKFEKGTALVDSFSYKISDGNGNTDYAVVKVNALGTAPLAVDDKFDFSLGNKGETFNPLANDEAGANGQKLVKFATQDGVSYTVNDKNAPGAITEVPGTYGTFKFNPDGTFTYDIKSDVAAEIAGTNTQLTETLDYYKISDGAGHTDVATITLILHDDVVMV